MGDNDWWFNKVGKVAPASNPGSAIPNYGLTYDLATAPTDEPDQFDALAESVSAYLAQTVSPVGITASGSGSVQDGTLWDDMSGAVGAVGRQIAGGVGALQVGVLKADQHMPEWSQLEATKSGEAADILDQVDDWGDYQDLGKARLGAAMQGVAESPGAEQIFWGLEKLNEYSSTLFVAATLAEDDMGLIFKSGTWGDAHELTKERHLNAGEAFVQMFAEKELLLDEERFEQVRQHNTVFNVGALAFNITAAWKLDPNVAIGKGLGAARDSAYGKLATNGRTAEVQRDILSAPDIDTAKVAADSYSGLADRLRAIHAVSLYDRSLQLREAAKAAKDGGFEDFKNLPAFRHSASGTVMAKLMTDVADDDAAWNLVFRSAIGDPDAVAELAARQGGVADKITAIEMKSMPRLEADLARTEARYQKRLAAQGRPADARIEIVRFGDKWLDDEVTALRAETEALSAHLATYSSHESWLQRALPGLDEDGVLDGNAPNSVFGNLDRLGGQGAVRRSLPSLGGKVKAWQHDDYSPISWVFRAPTKPFLSRVGVVSLNDVDEGAGAVVSYLDQMDYIRGGSSQVFRDSVISRFAGATTDMERKAVAEEVERAGIRTLGEKYKLSSEVMDQLGRILQEKRGKSWSNLSNNTIYSPIPGKNGPGYFTIVDDAGNSVRVKTPVDPTQLPNFHPLTNLTDLDRTIRQNLDELRDLDTDLASALRAGGSKVERWVTDAGDFVGSYFNSIWKPMALLSARWPMRVVADESMRVILLTGALAHMQQWGKAGGYALYNTGIVRPYEFWNGRKVKTGSLFEESMRPARNNFDTHDYRAITNPTGAVPADALDFGKLDKKRYNKINLATSERQQHLRSLEADRFRATTAPVQTPKWAKTWDDKLAAAEAATERGFFFDPISPNRTISKGFAVSIYPGRMRTFPRKPTAREMNFWTEKNSDLLAIPNSRVAVWNDKDTGRWHLDVVKITKRKEDAMLLASRAEATEFYDIEDGFTRYLSDDFYGHFDSPFVKPPTPNPAGGVAVDQAPLASTADQIGAQIGAAASPATGPTRKAVGFGTKKWRSRDGRVMEGEDVFGPDTANPNIYHPAVSSRSATEALYGGHTRGIGKDRASRQSQDWRTFDPDDPDTNLDHWAAAYAEFVNSHIRYSPLWQRMLDGKGDDEIYDWLMATAKGRAARKRMGVRGENPAKWLDDERAIFDHMFPNERSLEAARLGEIDPKRVLDLIPDGQRPFMHGEAFKMGMGTSQAQKTINGVVNSLMSFLGSVPTDALVRHPFAATVYNREMRNYISSVPADKITNNVMAAASASARAKAVRDVKRVLYNIADEREGVHLLRFVSPFFQAQVEVLERYARISMEKPETLARLAQLLVGSQVVNQPFWEVTDREGKPAEGYSSENIVTFQVNDTMREVADVFGLKGALDNAGELTIPVSSLNLITGGENPFLPSMGPLVSYPASEFYFRHRPELEDSAIYQWMYPFGVPQGGSAGERFINAMSPAWARRLRTAVTEDFDDSAFARRVGEIGAAQRLEWELGGQEGPRPTGQMALDAAKAEYKLRAASSFFLPAPLTPRSPYQFWIDQYRTYKEKYGLEADEKFYDEYGPTYFMFAQQATQSAGMGPTTGEKRAYDRYKGLTQQAPLLLGVLTGPFATDEFSDAVYQWQLTTRVSPDSTEMLRERLSPAERIAEAETSRGWVEYTKLQSAIMAEIRNRVAAGGSAYLTASTNADLAALKQSKMLEIFTRNPAWQDAYNSRSSEMAAWLGQAYDVAFDSKLDGRTDIEGLRTYLISRARLQDALRQREDSGLASSDQLSFDPLGNPIGDNADLGYAWMGYINELNARNPLFAEIYTRYLEDDDLSTYISPEVSNAS